MVRPRVTPPPRAFFRLSFTSVSSSSRFTRSSSFCLQSSSTFFSRSDSEACERLPDGRREFKFQTELLNDKQSLNRKTGCLVPAAASTAVRRSLLSFFSWVRWFLISVFFFISSSSLACSRLASASTRFFPYLHCSASAKQRPPTRPLWLPVKCENKIFQDSKTPNQQMWEKGSVAFIIRALGRHELPRNPLNSQPQPQAVINSTRAMPPPTGKYTEGNHPTCVCLCVHVDFAYEESLNQTSKFNTLTWHWKYENCVAYSESNMTHIWYFHSDIWRNDNSPRSHIRQKNTIANHKD